MENLVCYFTERYDGKSAHSNQIPTFAAWLLALKKFIKGGNRVTDWNKHKPLGMHELTISGPPPIPAILVSRDERGRDPGKAGNKRDGTECRITFFSRQIAIHSSDTSMPSLSAWDQITQSLAGHLKTGNTK